MASNKRFAEVQGFDNSLCKPGVKLETLIRFRAKCGGFADENIDEVIEQRVAKIAKLEKNEVQHKLANFHLSRIRSGRSESVIVLDNKYR